LDKLSRAQRIDDRLAWNQADDDFGIQRRVLSMNVDFGLNLLILLYFSYSYHC